MGKWKEGRAGHDKEKDKRVVNRKGEGNSEEINEGAEKGGKKRIYRGRKQLQMGRQGEEKKATRVKEKIKGKRKEIKTKRKKDRLKKTGGVRKKHGERGNRNGGKKGWNELIYPEGKGGGTHGKKEKERRKERGKRKNLTNE